MGNRPSWPRRKEDRREDHRGPEGGSWSCRVDGEVEREIKLRRIGIDSMVVVSCVVVQLSSRRNSHETFFPDVSCSAEV